MPAEPFVSEDARQLAVRLSRELTEVRSGQSTRTDCTFALKWAQTIRDATVHGLRTSPLERERAIRILITLADDAKLYPRWVDSTAEVYRSVAAFFTAGGDYWSAYCALDAARARASESGAAADEAFLREIGRQQAVLVELIRAKRQH